MAGRRLAGQGHAVVLHARSKTRAEDAQAALAPAGAAGVVVGDLSSLAGIRQVAEQADAAGPFDAVIHNAGVGHRDQPHRVTTEDGLSRVFTVNVLAPYLLTALMERPARLVYLSSGLHRDADASLEDAQWERRPWSGFEAYSESKLLDVTLAFAVARRWPDVRVNVVEPGWVPTRMGGPTAPDDLSLGSVTQAWLAVSDDPAATGTGGYFFHQQPQETHPAARDVAFQDELLSYCAGVAGVGLPA
jgi:NAD(P)-dependent dehydrogenase (short-subunit alcohol dehydrogenase family)